MFSEPLCASKGLLLTLRLLLVDDHELTRVGMRVLFASKPDWQICGEATNGKDAITQVNQESPDVVVLDVSMLGMNGFEAAEGIHQIAPNTKIVFYTMHRIPSSARLYGAECVCKADSPWDLVAAIERTSKDIP